MAFANLLDSFNFLHFQERPLLHYNYSDWLYHFLGVEITILIKFIQDELLARSYSISSHHKMDKDNLGGNGMTLSNWKMKEPQYIWKN